MKTVSWYTTPNSWSYAYAWHMSDVIGRYVHVADSVGEAWEKVHDGLYDMFTRGTHEAT